MTTNQDLAEIKTDAMQAYLVSIDFQAIAESGGTLAFRHGESGSVVTLTKREESEFVSPADFLSIWVRLESENLITEDAAAEFREGRLPIAS
jgi:hypothetical protein